MKTEEIDSLEVGALIKFTGDPLGGDDFGLLSSVFVSPFGTTVYEFLWDSGTGRRTSEQKSTLLGSKFVLVSAADAPVSAGGK